MDATEVKYWTVTRRAVYNADGSISHHLYHVPGWGDYRWDAFLELTRKLSEDYREAQYDRFHPYGQGL